MADDVEMTPITPAESSPVPPKVAPFGASAPAAAAPAAPAAAPSPSAGVSTIKLKPVIRKPQIHKPVIGGSKPPVSSPAAAAASAAAVKKATQNLKAVTGPIPMQATLRKTGIIAEGILTPAQQQAAKSKTSRISLESAIGVAPTKEAPAPMKTIRLRRPTDLKPGGPAPLVPPKPAVAEPPAAAEPAGEEAAVTQKKTLKLHRPGGGIKRPTLGAAPVSAGGDVADMPVADMSPVGGFAPANFSDSGQSSGVPAWVAALSLITSLAALAAVGLLTWHLWQEISVEGGNALPFLKM